MFLCLGLALVAVYELALSPDSLGAAVVYTAVSVLLACASVVGILVHRPERATLWWLFAAGWILIVPATAWLFLSPHLTGETVSFPSAADAFYIAGYLFLVAALVVLGSRQAGARDRPATVDALIVTLAVGAISWGFVVDPVLASGDADLAQRLVPLGYTVVDLLLLGGLVRLWFLRGRLQPASLLLTLGIVLQLVADEGYTVSVIRDTPISGRWYDAFYLLGWTMIGAAALHPSIRSLMRPDGPRDFVLTRVRFAFLAAAALLPPAMIVAEQAAGHDSGSLLALTCISAVMFLLVLLRMRWLLVDISQHREMQRLKGEFTSIVSHELRTPLTSIRGSLGLMAGGALGEMPEAAQRMLTIAVANTDRLVRLINDILDIESIQSSETVMEMQPLAAGELAEEALREMEGMACDAGVRLEASIAAVAIAGHRDRLIQTLVNLIGNAIKFAPAGSLVRVSVRREDDEAVFRVEDRGRGIPPEKLEDIFRAFEQVDASDTREKGGTGLGLAIARSIVHRHGGRIWAQSAVGEGSTFVVAIPALAEIVLDERAGDREPARWRNVEVAKGGGAD
jgi:signal transduction histidine kinase